MEKTFKENYPEVEKLEITVEEVSSDEKMKLPIQIYRDNDFVPVNSCHNPKCHNGGVSLKNILILMISSERTDLELETGCNGWEYIPRKGKIACHHLFNIEDGCKGYEGTPGKRKRACLHLFKVKIHIDYSD